MTFTYSNTSISTNLAKVRLRLGDTVDMVTDGESLTDEEIEYFLTIHADISRATLASAHALYARLSRLVTRSAGSITEQQRDKLDHLEKLIEFLKEESKSGATSALNAYSGQVSSGRLDDAEEDTDYEQPAFKVGQDDNTGTGNEDTDIRGRD